MGNKEGECKSCGHTIGLDRGLGKFYCPEHGWVDPKHVRNIRPK